MGSNTTYRNKQTTTAWQYKIRKEREAAAESIDNKYWERIDLSLKKARVREIPRAIAQKIILQYEWLGDMAVTNRYYGIFFENYCGGVIAINAYGTGPRAGVTYGIEQNELSYFARGACVFWTPTGTASKLLSKALLLEGERGAKVAVAFADTDAGEYGTVYQATNWYCLGQQKVPDDEMVKDSHIMPRRSITERARRNNMTPEQYMRFLIKKGWKRQKANPKYKYCYIIAKGKERQEIYNKIKHLIKPYPKRQICGSSVVGSTDNIQLSGGVRGDPAAQK